MAVPLVLALNSDCSVKCNSRWQLGHEMTRDSGINMDESLSWAGE